MATDGQNSKKKHSFKQRVNHRRFRISGAAGFADGALGAAINRLNALAAEFPISSKANRRCVELIQATLREAQKNISELRMAAHRSAEVAELEWGGGDDTNNSSGS
jgi:outer membrane protein assembly factor BamD (BamD/ComL family)